MKKETKLQNNLAVYQTKDGAIELRADSDRETVWATQAQIAKIFDIERSVITKHVRKIIKDGELDENSVCAIFAHTGGNVKFENEGVSAGVNEGVNEGVKSLYQTILRKPGIRLPELSNILQVPAKTLERWIRQLRNEKRIVFKGAPKTGGYFIYEGNRES